MENVNIWDTPWVKVCDDTGQVFLLTFEEFLRTSHQYIWFAGEGSAVQDASVFRFTLALLHWGLENVYSLPYMSEEDTYINSSGEEYDIEDAIEVLENIWKTIYLKREIPSEVIDWLKENTYEHFWLFTEGEKAGLLQVILKEDECKIFDSLTWLMSDYWKSNNSSSYAKNRCFDEIPSQDEMIRGLIKSQLCNDQSLKPYADYSEEDKDESLIKAAFTDAMFYYVRGETIFDSLMLSMAMYPTESNLWSKDKVLFVKDLSKYVNYSGYIESVAYSFADLTYYPHMQVMLSLKNGVPVLSTTTTKFKGFAYGIKSDLYTSAYTSITQDVDEKTDNITVSYVKPNRYAPVWKGILFDTTSSKNRTIKNPFVIDWLNNVRHMLDGIHLTASIIGVGSVLGKQGNWIITEVSDEMQYSPTLFDNEIYLRNATKQLTDIAKVVYSYSRIKTFIDAEVTGVAKDKSGKPKLDVYMLDKEEYGGKNRFYINLLVALSDIIGDYLISDFNDKDTYLLWKNLYETLMEDWSNYLGGIKADIYLTLYPYLNKIGKVFRDIEEIQKKYV